MTFSFNRHYDDREQVRPYMTAFAALRREMEQTGQYPYNDAFKGRIPELAGPDEDTAIYLLQGLYRIGQEHAAIEEYRRDGYETLTRLDATTRYKRVVLWVKEKYVGGTGEIIALEDARVIPAEDGTPYAVLPKGKRRNGYNVSRAEVLVR